MKKTILKHGYLLAAILAVLGIAFFFFSPPKAGMIAETGFQQQSRKTFEQVLGQLETFGFADPEALQKQALKEILATFDQGDYEGSEKALTSYLSEYPDNKEAAYYLGLSQLYAGKKVAAKETLERLSNDPNFEYQQDAEWFCLIAAPSLTPEGTRVALQKIAGNNGHKYQQPAATLLASMAMNHATFSFDSTAQKNQFAIVVQPQTRWWQHPAFRYGLLVLLPIGGIGLAAWKRKMEAANEEAIAVEVAAQTAALRKDKESTEEILNNILPASVVEEIKKYGQASSQRYEMVSVLFCDFVGFSKISKNLPPEELVNYLQTIFGKFEKITRTYQLEEIKTMGDCFICAGGLKKGKPYQAVNIVKAAFQMLAFLEDFNRAQQQKGAPLFRGRIGINTGAVVAGIVGVKKYAYDIWGDTVNVAARMEQNSEPGKINVSGHTYELIRDHYHCEHRGKLEAKGVGQIDMYYVQSEK